MKLDCSLGLKGVDEMEQYYPVTIVAKPGTFSERALMMVRTGFQGARNACLFNQWKSEGGHIVAYGHIYHKIGELARASQTKLVRAEEFSPQQADLMLIDSDSYRHLDSFSVPPVGKVVKIGRMKDVFTEEELKLPSCKHCHPGIACSHHRLLYQNMVSSIIAAAYCRPRREYKFSDSEQVSSQLLFKAERVEKPNCVPIRRTISKIAYSGAD